MKNYVLTVFNKKGEKLLDEPFEAQNDEEAKSISLRRLDEEGHNELPYRCTASNARLVLFNSSN